MRKINSILALGFILILIGCSSSVPDAEALYQTYLKACPLNFKVTSYDLKYHGVINIDSTTYHLLGYSYAWEVNPGNCRGNGQILVFDGKKEFIGYFEVFGDPEVTITGKRMDDAVIVTVICLSILVYNLYKLKQAKDPKDDLLKAKQLLDQKLIDPADYEKIKKKLVKRIVSD
jgi:hypothetical protein